MADDVLSHTAQKPARNSGATVRAEDDQVSVPLFRDAKNLDTGVPELDESVGSEAGGSKLRHHAIGNALGCLAEGTGQRFRRRPFLYRDKDRPWERGRVPQR